VAWRLRWLSFTVLTIFALAALVFIQWREHRDEHRAQHQATQKAKDIPPPELADDRIADYTLALAILTGCLVAVSAIQIRFLISADQNAKTAADAALEQTTHLSSQADTMKAMQRAFLAVDSIGIENIHGIPIIAKTRIKNTGNVAASGVRWIVYADTDINPRRKLFMIDKNKIDRSNNIIAPKADMVRFTNISKDYSIIPANFEEIRTRAKVLYICGKVYYFDGIAPTERWTRFCHRYEADCLKTGSANITDERVRQHQHGNGTDEYPQRADEP
jgi:hypothetical protein